MKDLPEPVLERVCRYTVDLAPPIELGKGRGGMRRIIPIVGGLGEGERLSGRIVNLGADWQTVFNDGLAELDTRYGIETHDGAFIDVRNYGYRHGPPAVLAALAAGEDVAPDAYTMRTVAQLETGDERYAWVNRTLFIGVGARFQSSVRIDLYSLR